MVEHGKSAICFRYLILGGIRMPLAWLPPAGHTNLTAAQKLLCPSQSYFLDRSLQNHHSMAKCRFGAPLVKRLDSRKETETRLKLVAHDIWRVGYLEIMGDVVPHWSGQGVREFRPKAAKNRYRKKILRN